MREYELVLILDPAADEAAVGAAVERVSQVLGDRGEVGDIDRWGKRRLAYEINKLTEGYYVLVSLKADPTITTELERVLSLADQVIRYKLMKKVAA